MLKKLLTKLASKKIEKTAIQSPNFYLNGGEPEEDTELNDFLKDRFNNYIQDKILTKNASKKVAQHNFYRIDRSPEEEFGYNKSQEIFDFKMLSYPGSLMEILFDGETITSEVDEESLYSLWVNSDTKDDAFLNVSSNEISKAEKLMNRGYVIDKGGKYQITEKGRKVLIGKILGSRPDYKWDINKTSDYHGDSSYVIRGTDISLNNPFFTKDKDYAIILADDQVVRKIEKEGLFSPEKVQWANRNMLAIPMNIVEEKNSDESVNPFISDDGQIFGHNSHQSNSPWANKPIGGEEIPVMSGFSNSKIFGMLKESSKINSLKAKKRCISELSNRGLKTKIIANDDASREKGLMYSEPLKENECAVFIFENKNNLGHTSMVSINDDLSNSNPGFWNKNVSFPIDVAFYNNEGILVSVKRLEANQLDPVFSGSNDIKYVVETQKGWYDKNNIKKGSNIWEAVESLPRT